jgi:hypothetical protein
MRGEASLFRGTFVVFHHLSAYEIWPHKRCGLWLEWPHKRGTTIVVTDNIFLHKDLKYFDCNHGSIELWILEGHDCMIYYNSSALYLECNVFVIKLEFSKNGAGWRPMSAAVIYCCDWHDWLYCHWIPQKYSCMN